MTPANLVGTRSGTKRQDMQATADAAPSAEVIEMKRHSVEFSLAALP